MSLCCCLGKITDALKIIEAIDVLSAETGCDEGSISVITALPPHDVSQRTASW